MLTNIYRGDYDTDADIEPAILEATREIFSRSVDKGIKQSHFDPSASFKKQIHHSADIFSAFRVHTMTKEVVSRLHDDNGRLRSFSEFAEAVQPYVSHQNRAWLQTEYSTAVRRAHDAADWQQFEAEKDVLPNLRWMPSTSAKPGQDHMEFWGTVLPVDDPFWKEHRPGDRWNCKCSLSSTDDEPTSRPTAKESTPQPGLKTKPTDAELFSQDHPYYADSCTSCPFRGSKLMALLHDLSGKRDCNSCSGVNSKLENKELIQEREKVFRELQKDPNYKSVEFNHENGGLKASHIEHNFDSDGAKYETMAQDAGFNSGHAVILEKEVHSVYKKRNCEGTWDSLSFEVAGKLTASQNNIREGLKHCAKKPNCKVAVLVFPNNNFDLETFYKGLGAYNGLRDDPNQWAHFDKIICIQNETIVYEKSHQL